ncbi:glycosyltransferase [Rhodococcus triatomae]|nr:hypothetical protein G419_04068 [Rhodococcus triatomae BKS 15-14]
MIGYYIHHQGRGHYFRAATIAAATEIPITALSSTPPLGETPFADYVLLDRDDDPSYDDPSAGGDLHWAPAHSPGLRARMATIARWIDDARPDALVVDVSVEVALFARLMGVPVIVVAMPGNRGDRAHQAAYRVADRIIAAWPPHLYSPSWLAPHLHKTEFVGGISRFTGRTVTDGTTGHGQPRVLVLGGVGGSTVTADHVSECAHRHRDYEWTVLGLPGSRWSNDPWPELISSDVVVAHAGQGAVADIAAARRAAVVIPQPRPYDEQATTARVLAENRFAVALDGWPAPDAWTPILDQARARGGGHWAAWGTDCAARRAASVLHQVQERG